MTLTPCPVRLLKKAAFLVSCLVLLAFDCLGQAARPDRGVMPTGSYAISDIENVNLTNGNLNLSIPLASLPPMAGGKLGFTVRAEYNSKGWDTVRQELQSDPLNPATKYVVTHLQQSGGWRIGGAYQISFEDITWDYDWLAPSPNEPEYNLLTQNRWSKVILIAPDGATHELRPVDYFSYADPLSNHSYLRGYYKDDPNTAGTALRYYSYDGSHLWAKIDPSPYLYAGAVPSWVIYLPDGTRVEQANGIQRIIDTNGNKVKIWTDGAGTVWTTHYQDEQTGRQIKYVYDSAGNGGQGLGQVQYQTVGGTWMTITINLGTTQVLGKVHAVNDPECGDPSVLIDAEIPVVRSIVFPQTEPGQPARQLAFSYNSDTTDTVSVQWRPNCAVSYQTITSASRGWGSLSRIVLTSGAIVDYAYSFDGETYASFAPDDAPREHLTTKTVTHDGISETWTYGLTPDTSGVTSPDGSVVTEKRYPSDPAFSHNYAGFGGKEGLVYRTNHSNRTLIERHWSLMTFSGGDNIAPGGSVLVAFNPVVDVEYTTLLDDTPAHNPVKMSARTFQYDYNGNLLTQTDYDWFDPALVSRDAQGVPTAVPASATVLRVTNNSYYNQATAASSSNVYAKRSVSTATPLILNALKEGTVGPSIVQLSYDGQAYGMAPTVGNLTRQDVWANLDSKWITTSNTYGLYGNVATATDARGKVTQFFYDDATHALPNRVVVDPQNGTGTQTTTTTYDYDTGLVTNQTDVNGQISTIDYTNQLLGTIDPFGRPGITFAPQINVGGTNYRRRVTITYLDSARQVIVAADLNAEDDKLLKTRTTTDQLGRPIMSEQTEDGTNYTISGVNKYLDMGRVTLTSSARRGTASTTDSWTRITKDNAGRVIEVATFGGATQPAWSGTTGVFTGAVTTAYDANFTTVTDQAGKVRRSMVDALGRLRRVDEPDTSGNLNSTTNPAQPTSYAYDVLGNLTTVTQGSQTRNFTYDSLSRLRTAMNPESGTISYQYDDNGNLLVKTDARNVSAHFKYDALNRITRRWYNNLSSPSSETHDLTGLPSVGTTSEAKFYYDSLPEGAPVYTQGSAVGRLVAQTYGTGSNGDYFAYDVLGRATLKIQQTGTVNYQLSATYKLSGAIDTLTYPSGHTVTHTYDQAGRLTALSGNLGDGITRTYATGILYSPTGGLEKEQFGTAPTPVYNKRFYNSRGQLAAIRASTSYTGPTDYDANRGAIINRYSSQCTGECFGSMPDNNGNLKQQDIQIPSAPTRSQFYEYDSLNRLLWAREVVSGNEQWRQWFSYDRWGNRTIDTTINPPPDGLSRTYGVGINNTSFEKFDAANQLYAPGDLVLPMDQRRMRYDAAGNLTHDTYTGAGNRTYDGENKITSAWGRNNQAQLYSYDASGQRIKRTVDGVETWQVYGFGGELVAEYAASGAVTSPQKEYGYRNGQMLVTAPSVQRLNVAASANGGTATASETHSAPYASSGAINGDRKFYTSNAWANVTATYPQWLQVDFGASRTIDEVDVFSIQDNPSSPSEPTLSMTFTNYGLTAFQVQYWNGSSWTTVPNGQVTGNNKVWKQITFSPITTSKIKVVITGTADGYSRVAEVEAWGTALPTPRANIAASSNGGTATASETHSAPYVPSGAINGDRKLYTNNAWANVTATYPQWLQVDFNGSKVIDEVDVFSIQDNPSSPSEPTLSLTFNNYGVTAFEVQYWNGSSWLTVPNGQITGNNKVWKQISFSPITTSKIKVVINGTADGYSRLAEVEAWGIPAGSVSDIQWLISDHLGTPRMVLDQTGSLAGMKRHDYLPFGEELVAPAGGDGVRQQFTLKERDIETGLDYFGARYYASTQGRFTGADPYDINFERQETADSREANALFTAYIGQPQHWNRYAYALNNPLKYVDPDGLYEYEAELLGKKIKVHIDDSIINNKKDPDALKRIQGNLQKAFDKINAGADKLTKDQIQSIGSMSRISVSNQHFLGMNGSTFQITQRTAENPNLDKLSADIIHDSRHGEQSRRGLSYNETTAIPMEMEASQFAVDVMKSAGGWDAKVLQGYEEDARTGHLPPGWKDKSTPKTREKVFSTMKKPRK